MGAPYFKAVARVFPEGGPHKHEADEQILVEYDLTSERGQERVLAIGSLIYDGLTWSVRWDDGAARDNPSVQCAALEVHETVRSLRICKLPIVDHAEASRQVAERWANFRQEKI
jgi:hypothetical protein